MRWMLVVAFAATPVASQAPATFDAWEDTYQFDCNAPFAHFSPPDMKTLGAFRYEHTGATVKVRRASPRPGKAAKLGLLAGIKDVEPETLKQVSAFIASFEAADVDAIVVGGDSSSEPEVLEAVDAYLAKATQRPVLVLAGNMERGAAHSYALIKARKAGALNLINMDIVRRYDGEGFDVVSLGGYHDKAYLHLSGGCLYTDKQIDDVGTAAAAADDAVVLLTHGPPRDKGNKGIDFVPGAGNVGDARLNEALSRAKIRFGISGHILEAAGKATELNGKPLPQGVLLKSLFVNQGSANPLPWKLNDGSTSYGLAAVLTLEAGKGSYQVLRAPKPATP